MMRVVVKVDFGKLTACKGVVNSIYFEAARGEMAGGTEAGNINGPADIVLAAGDLSANTGGDNAEKLGVTALALKTSWSRQTICWN